jgi:hypothetical protein
MAASVVSCILSEMIETDEEWMFCGRAVYRWTDSRGWE